MDLNPKGWQRKIHFFPSKVKGPGFEDEMGTFDSPWSLVVGELTVYFMSKREQKGVSVNPLDLDW